MDNLSPVSQDPRHNMADLTFFEYVEDCTEQLFSAAQNAGINREDIKIDAETSNKLKGYKNHNSVSNPPSEKEKDIARLEGLDELEGSIMNQAEASGSSIENYTRPHLPAHLQVQIDSIPLEEANFPNTQAANKPRHNPDIQAVPSQLKPEETHAKKPESNKEL